MRLHVVVELHESQKIKDDIHTKLLGVIQVPDYYEEPDVHEDYEVPGITDLDLLPNYQDGNKNP